MIPLEGRSWRDARGWGVRPLDAASLGPDALGDLHVVSLVPGAVRGNHLHPGVTEWMLLFGAPVTLAWLPPGAEPASLRLELGEPVLVEIPAGVGHALRGEGPGETFLVSWADGAPTTERTPPLL